MIRSLCIIILLVFSLEMHAQTNTNSPYSIYGIGDSPYSSLSAQAAMGHTGIATLSALNVNTINPATQTYISRPTFNFDVRNEILVLNATAQSQSNHLFSIENFSFAFPIINSSKFKRNAAVSFGLVPYSRQGYEVVSNETVQGIGNVEYRFIGEGGINSAYLSGSYDLIADSGRVNTLSLGLTGAYVFGSISQNRITTLDSNILATNLYREQRTEVSSADIKIGLLYTRLITFTKSPDNPVYGSFSIGGYYKPSLSLNSSSNQTAYTFLNTYKNPVIMDTIDLSSSNEPLLVPASFGLGMSYNYDDRWTVALDLTAQQWSNLEINGVNSGLNDARRASLGIEYVPDPTAYKQLLKVTRYRTGFSYEQTRLNVNGVQPNQVSVSAGLGIPVIATRSTSMINLGTEYVIRGATGLPLSETFLNIYFGFTVTPNQFDRWFVKRKYD